MIFHDAGLLKASVQVRRFFPPVQLLEEMQDQLPFLLKGYPENADAHQQLFSDIVSVSAENCVVVNASTELDSPVQLALCNPDLADRCSVARAAQ